MFKTTLLALAAAAAALALPAAAQSQDPKAELRSALRGTLVPLLGDSSRDLVMRMLSIKPDRQISENFDLNKLYQAAFGRSGGTAAADCRINTTPTGEADSGECVYEQGKRDDPNGAYAALAFSKFIGQGDVKFVKRPAFVPGGSTSPTPVKLSDAAAYQAAMDFARLAGVPLSEVPQAPAGAKNPLPVRSLYVGAGRERGDGERVPIQKVISVQRAFVVPGGLFQDPQTGIIVQHVLGPGTATFVVDDGGVQFARVDGWSDAVLDPKLNPALAKSVSDLIDEIADDLHHEGVRRVGSLSVRLSLRRAYPHPDDPNPPLCPVCGVLRPAIQVAVSQVGSAPIDTSGGNFVAPGVMREYDLVAATEAERPAR